MVSRAHTARRFLGCGRDLERGRCSKAAHRDPVALLDALESVPEAVLHVVDDLTCDARGAARAGMRAAWLRPAHQDVRVMTYTHMIRELKGKPRISAEKEITRARRKPGGPQLDLRRGAQSASRPRSGGKCVHRPQ